MTSIALIISNFIKMLKIHHEITCEFASSVERKLKNKQHTLLCVGTFEDWICRFCTLKVIFKFNVSTVTYFPWRLYRPNRSVVNVKELRSIYPLAFISRELRFYRSNKGETIIRIKKRTPFGNLLIHPSTYPEKFNRTYLEARWYAKSITRNFIRMNS